MFDKEKFNRLADFFLFGIAIQCLHFFEEFISGFHILFPEFLKLSAWSTEFYVSFNLCWIAIWLVSVVGIRRDYQLAFFLLWFFTIGMVLNLIAHYLLAFAHNGYFPGLNTSPFVGIIGIVLWVKLNDLKIK